MSYNRDWIDNKFVRRATDKLAAYDLLTQEEHHKAIEVFSDKFYSPNLFIRIGLFIFTAILTCAAFGIVGTFLFAISSAEQFIGFVLFAGAGILIFALEYFINNKKHYRSGIDDCLLYMAVAFVISGFILITENYSAFAISLVSLPLLVIGAIRYADSFLTLLSIICLYVLIFIMITDYTQATSFLPFIYLIISLSLFIITQKKSAKENSDYWHLCLKVSKFVSLLCVYLSVNYFVVKEGNFVITEQNLDTRPTPEMVAMEKQKDANREIINNYYGGDSSGITADQIQKLESEMTFFYAKSDSLISVQLIALRNAAIPFGVFFMIMTIVLPIVYIFIGLMRKDRVILNSGLLIMVASICTFQYYYSIIGFEKLMTLMGVLMIVVSWFVIRKLRQSPGKFTYDEELNTGKDGLRNLEALVVAKTMGQVSTQTNDGLEFGDGKYGGGGAGGNF